MSLTRKLLVLFLVATSAIHIFLWWQTRDQLQKGYQDFVAFYCAGWLLSHGQSASLYDVTEQYRVQQQFAPNVPIRKGPMVYIHPPAEALIFMPFAKLPYFMAYLLWDFVNLIAFGTGLFVLRSHLPTLRTEPAILWLLIGLGFFPVFLAVLLGQDILPLVLLYTLAWVAMQRRCDFKAGCWLGLGLFRFHLVLPFLLVAALQKRWRIIGGSTVAAAVITLISIAVAGVRVTLAYPLYVWRIANQIGTGVNAPENMPNLHGLLYVLLPFGETVLRPTIVAVSLGLILLSARSWTRGADRELCPLQFSTALIATLLVSYHGYDYDLSLTLLPLLLILNYVQMHPAPRATLWRLLAPPFVLFLTPLQMIILFRWRYACFFSIVLLVWFWGIAREVLRLPHPSPSNLHPAP